MWLYFKLQFILYIKFGSINHYPWEFNILQRTLTIWAWWNIAGNYRIHGLKNNLWVKKLYVSIEQAVFWLEVVCCLGKELGEEVDRSPSPTPTKTSFVSTNDHWSVNKNSKVELKIYDVFSLKFDAVTGEMPRVSTKCKIGISVKCRVLVQASKLIKSSSV